MLEQLFKLAFPSVRACPSCGDCTAVCPSCGTSAENNDHSNNNNNEELYLPSFRHLCFLFFRLHLSHNIPPYDPAIEVKHFTDLCRKALVGTQFNPNLGAPISVKELPNAVKLRKSGVKFKRLPSSNSEGYLVDIKVNKKKRGITFTCMKKLKISFTDEVELQIPRIYINDDTESLMRNIMALEQFRYPSQAYICGYVELMDFLIEDEDDVDFLVEKEIISNGVSSKAVIANLFNGLCRKIPSSNSYYSDVRTDLRNHYDKPINHCIATLKRVYFSDTWTSTATLAAIALLLLTLAQTVFSVLQVVLPK